MLRLPKEIILLIISDFSFKEKLEVALVSRKWLEWIRASNLYKKISIDNPDRYRAALDYFEDYNYCGTLVSELSVKECESNLLALLKLPELFPFLKRFEWFQEYIEPIDNYEIYRQEINDKYYEKQLQKWKHLETIEEENTYFPITYAILKSPTSAANLKSISITRSDNDLVTTPDDIKFIHHISLILNYVQNAPELSTLVLENFLVTWNDMDRLHKKARKLKSITFKNMFLRSTNEGYESSDKSSDDESSTTLVREEATSLESFSIHYDHNVFEFERGNIYWWTRYMAKKYPDISSFSLTYTGWIFMPISATSYEETMEFCLACWPRLKRYNVKIGTLTKTLLDVMDNNKIALEDITVYIGESTDTQQYKNLMTCKQLESIKAITIIERSKFGSEDVYGKDMFALFRQMPKLQKINLILSLGSPENFSLPIINRILNNALYVEHLTVPNLLAPPESFVPLLQDSKLKSLHIEYLQFSCENVNLDLFHSNLREILFHCPLLETFKIQLNIYEGETRETSIFFDFTRNHNIKNIQIDCLYETTFRIVRAGQVKYYVHTKENQFIQIPENSAFSPYLNIFVNKDTRITADLLC